MLRDIYTMNFEYLPYLTFHPCRQSRENNPPFWRVLRKGLLMISLLNSMTVVDRNPLGKSGVVIP